MLAFSHWVDFMELVRLREQEEREAVERFDNEFPDAPHSRAKVVLRDMLGLVDKLMNSKLRANWEFLEYVLPCNCKHYFASLDVHVAGLRVCWGWLSLLS